MLRNISELTRRSVEAYDGEIGKITGFCFDNQRWIIRYLVAETGSWLNRRHVLLSTACFEQPSAAVQGFPVRLTREQIKDSPPVDISHPVSREYEQNIVRYYGWPAYWDAWQNFTPVTVAMPGRSQNTAVMEREAAAERLISTWELFGRELMTAEGDAGEITDAIVDDATWEIRYLVVNTGTVMSGKNVLLLPQWLAPITDNSAHVTVNIPRDLILQSPPYDPSFPITRVYENRWYDYYGIPKYWRRY